MSRAVDDFIQHADMKLDESVAGKIYKRQEIEEIVSKARELAELLPSPEDALDCPPIREDFLEMLQSSAGDTDKILEEANNFFENLSKEEWDEMVESYNRKS